MTPFGPVTLYHCPHCGTPYATGGCPYYLCPSKVLALLAKGGV
jgi:hypothetical protein